MAMRWQVANIQSQLTKLTDKEIEAIALENYALYCKKMTTNTSLKPEARAHYGLMVNKIRALMQMRGDYTGELACQNSK